MQNRYIEPMSKETERYQPYRRKNKVKYEEDPYTEAVRAAAARAKKMASQQMSIDDDTDDDTASIASSASSVSRPFKKSGVSPLNRRRSLRLAQKEYESSMETSPIPSMASLERKSTTYSLRQKLGIASLHSQDTVNMNSKKPRLERMQTSKRWSGWRKQPSLAKSDTIAPPAMFMESSISENHHLRTTKPKSITSKKPSMMKKKSTTWALRQQMAGTALEQNQEGTDEVDGIAPKRSKRKAPSMPVVVEEEEEEKTTTNPKGKEKKVTYASTASNGRSALKRQASLSTSKLDGKANEPQSKRRCQALQRSKSMTVGGAIYIPPQELWPLELDAQVVWFVPLENPDKTKRNGLGVFVEPERCLIGDESGTILELNAKAAPVRRHVLPSGVKCLVEDGGFIYAGCNDGGLYDVTNKETRLIHSSAKFGQLLSLDVFNGLIALSDDQGVIAMVTENGLTWKHESDGKFGWMVRIDETGVYHGHAAGVTKYSTLDGSVIWNTKLENSVKAGDQTSNYVYVGSGGEVVKIDKKSGDIEHRYCTSDTGNVHSLTVACGCVFAGGHKIVCYDEATGDVMYILHHTFHSENMQYYSGRLFCVGKGAMSVVDITDEIMENAQKGKYVETTTVNPVIKSPMILPLKRVPTISAKKAKDAEGVMVECVKLQARKGVVKVRALSAGYNSDWTVQFPTELCGGDSKFLVKELSPTSSEGFYRVVGDIKQIEG